MLPVACTGVFTTAVDNAYTAYINGVSLVSDGRAAGTDNIEGCDDTTTNALGDVMTGCSWQSADIFEFTNLDGPLVIGIDGRDAGGIGGIMANVAVNGQNYVSGSAWRCWQSGVQTELSAHDMQVGPRACRSCHLLPSRPP